MTKLNKIPRTWNQLVKLRDFLSDCAGENVRLPEDRLFYKLQLGLVPRDISLEIIKRQMKNKSVSLILNNYPYTRTLKYLPNVKHYCLWSSKGRLSEREIKKQVLKKFKNKEWFYCERKSKKKSIPELWHCHIFVREEK